MLRVFNRPGNGGTGSHVDAFPLHVRLELDSLAPHGRGGIEHAHVYKAVHCGSM